MPPAWGILKGLSEFFIKTRIGNALGLLLIACIALMAWTHHVQRGAAQKIVAQVTQATETETDRRLKALAETQEWVKHSVDELHTEQAANAKTLKEIEHASHAHDSQPCLSADAVQRLQSIH